MVEVRFQRAPDGLVERFEARGHAGYARAGRDIVCSAVTAVLFTAVGYAESVYNPEGLPEKVRYKDADGFLVTNAVIPEGQAFWFVVPSATTATVTK